MTIVKTFTAIAILSTVMAAPVLARDASPGRHDHLRIHHGPAHHHVRDFRGAYNLRNEGFHPSPRYWRNTDNVRGRDPSRIGGEDPDLHPSAW